MTVSAAIRPDSVPALAVEKALLYFEVCACDETWAELETVLFRPKFDPYAVGIPTFVKVRLRQAGEPSPRGVAYGAWCTIQDQAAAYATNVRELKKNLARAAARPCGGPLSRRSSLPGRGRQPERYDPR